MAIDARIPLMGQPIQLNSPLNMLARAQGVENMRQTNALNAMQMEDARTQRAMQQQAVQARAQALASLPPPPVDAPPEWHQMHKAVTLGLAQPKEYFDLVTKPRPDRKLTIVGKTAIDTNTAQPVYTEPATPEKPPEIVRLIEARDAMPQGDPRRVALDAYITKQTTHAPASSNVTYAAPVPFLQPDGSVGYAQPGNRPGAQPMVMTGPDGKPLQKPPEAAKDNLTEGQAKATALLGQMRSASGELEKLGGAATTLSKQAEVALAGGPANIAISAKAQQINQARMQWAEAFLRFKTGAASTPAEVKANVETFFPKIGDGPEVSDQKARMRAQAEKDMEIAAGKGASKLAPASGSVPADIADLLKKHGGK